jgi:hypothetical protein
MDSASALAVIRVQRQRWGQYTRDYEEVHFERSAF